MLAAIPLFGSRVSPRCLFSESMIVARVEAGDVVSRSEHCIKGLSEDALLDELVELGVETLVCGGADQAFIENADMCGIKVIPNVAGEVEMVLQALGQGRLTPGFGLQRDLKVGGPPPAIPRQPVFDCLSCPSRACLKGLACPRGLANRSTEVAESDARIMEVAADVSCEEERKLCRVAELVHFGLGMGYRRVGVAFCVEMFREAEILCDVLKRFFEVVPVCCRIGTRTDVAHAGPVACNVIAQADALNARHTQLNLMVGLCIGCDLLFSAHSQAPATTLFVKDKSLANNPVGALYSSYYLDDLMSEPATPKPQGGLS